MTKSIQSLIHDFVDLGIPRDPGSLHPDAKKHPLKFNDRGIIDFVKPICVRCGSRHVRKDGIVVKQVLSLRNPRYRFACQHYHCSDCGKPSSPILTFAVIYDAQKDFIEHIAEVEEITQAYLTDRCTRERFGGFLVDLIDELYTQHLNIPVTKNAIYSRKDIVEFLVRNVIRNQSSEMSGNLLEVSHMGENMPSSDTVMLYLGRMGYADIRKDIKHIFDTINHKAESLGFYSKDRKVPVAIDYHEVPYFGKCREYTIRVRKDKVAKGARFAFKYATADVVQNGKRLTVYGQHISQLERKDEIFKEIVNYVKAHIGISQILGDKEFFTVDILRFLDEERIPYIIPAVKNKAIVREATKNYYQGIYVFSYRFGKGKNAHDITLFTIPNPDYDPSKPTSEHNSELNVFVTNIPIVPQDHTAEGARSLDERRSGFKIEGHRRKDLAERYRNRWGIETDYRVLDHEFRPMTTTNNFSIRYLYFFTGVILRNIWELSKHIFAEPMKKLFPRVKLRAKVWKYLVEKGLDARHVRDIISKLQGSIRALYLAFTCGMNFSSW